MTSTEDEMPRFHLEHDGRRSGTLPTFADDTNLRALLARADTGRIRTGPTSDNPYALQPDTLNFLTAILNVVCPRLIVEFGSGQSTKLFASWACAHDALVVSVEHDRQWVDEVSRSLDSAGRKALKIVHAPLRPKRFGLRQFLTYRSLSKLTEDVERADFLLLDSHRASDRQIGALGVTHDWRISRRIVARVRVPVILAGGLGPDNVADAIRAVRPAGVDSKTKTDRDGSHVKDLDCVRRFHAAAKAATAAALE